MLAHMIDKSDNVGSIDQCSKVKPNTFLDAFCKIGNNPDGFKPN